MTYDLPDLAVCPHSGIVYRLMGDDLWHPLDAQVGSAGTHAPPWGAVRYNPQTAGGYPMTGTPQRAAELAGGVA